MSAPFGLPIASPAAERLVDDGERLDLAGLTFEVREIPGHSPGSVVFVCDDFQSALCIRRRRALRRLDRPDRPGRRHAAITPAAFDPSSFRFPMTPSSTRATAAPPRSARRNARIRSSASRPAYLHPALNERLGDFRPAPVFCQARSAASVSPRDGATMPPISNETGDEVVGPGDLVLLPGDLSMAQNHRDLQA